MPRPNFLERFALKITQWSGSSWAFALAAATILVWLISGPIFRYSDTWQLVINTGTTIVTFLMVFLIQRSQNKESSEDEVATLHQHYAKLSELAESDGSLQDSHSIEEAEERHGHKAGISGSNQKARSGKPTRKTRRPKSHSK
jgi:low affinity Fe/Cu permease